MKKILLHFGTYENVTYSGQDGTTIQFLFTMVDNSMIATPEESQATTQHILRVGVAARINWSEDELFLVQVLFAVGKQRIFDELCLHGKLPEMVTTFVPHGKCPVDPKTLSDPEGAIVEVEIP